jgi:hypothetical protein
MMNDESVFIFGGGNRSSACLSGQKIEIDLDNLNHKVFAISESDDKHLSNKIASCERVKEILIEETSEASKLRSDGIFHMSYEMVSRQENEIKSAFDSVDHIRAELAELYVNKVTCSLDKILLLYSKASLKEICARNVYANMVMISAQNDVKLNNSNAMYDWIYRIQNDTNVLNESQRLKDSQNTTSTAINIRKKNLFNLNRAKAILKADQKAFTAG